MATAVMAQLAEPIVSGRRAEPCAGPGAVLLIHRGDLDGGLG